MQQSFMILFCSECGLANNSGATHCSAYQHALVSLTPPREEQIPATPIAVTPPVLQEMLASGSPVLNQKSVPVDVQLGTILAGKYRIENAATLAKKRQEASRLNAFMCIALILFAGGLWAILFAFAQLFP